MSGCKDCAARRRMIRDAWLNSQLGETAKQAAIGALELVGLKSKTGAEDLAQSETVPNSKEHENE